MNKALLRLAPATVDEALKATMRRIQLQNRKAHQLAMKTFALVLYAARPLTIEELLEALVIKEWSTQRKPNDTIYEEVMLECCHGLVMIQTADRTVHFCHYSVQQYLRTNSHLLRPGLYLAKICLTYLLYDDIHSCNSVSATILKYPFLRYASQYWTVHVRGDGESDPKILHHLGELFKAYEKVQTLAQLQYSTMNLKKSSNEGVAITTPLHLVAGGGLALVTSSLLALEKSREYDSTEVGNIYGWTPLHEASRGGHHEVVALLLQHTNCSGINKQDNEGMTALQHAAERGHTEVIRILLRKGANVTGKDDYGRNALSIALTYHEGKSARMIFNKMLKSDDGEGDIIHKIYPPLNQTLLHQIANLGYNKGVKTLLKMGANPHSEDNWGYTPVHLAVRKGHLHIVRTLLKAMNNVVLPSYCGHTLLQLAAKHGHDSIVELLLSTNREDSNSRDFLGFTPLHSAAAAGQYNIVKDLMQITELVVPAEVHVPSPYQLALWGGHKDILELLANQSLSFSSRLKSVEDPEYSAEALNDIHRATEKFSPRATFPYHLNGLCYLAEHYGLMHLKSGRPKLASAWYDIALLTHPVNQSLVDPSKTINPMKVCDRCNTKPIVGPCHTCTTCIGPCYDLCSTCFKQHSQIHEHDHYITIPASSYPLPSLDAHLKTLKQAMKEHKLSVSL